MILLILVSLFISLFISHVNACDAGTCWNWVFGCACCNAGRWGNGGGGMDSNCMNSCTGAIAAGYWGGNCEGNPRPNLCAAGRYGTGGDSSSWCSGPCIAGRYGTQGETSYFCTGDCHPGYYCQAGSSSPTQYTCGPGTWSGWGSSSCSPCSPGYYGSSNGLQSSSCSAQCPPGYYCPSGSSSPISCPVGRYGSSYGLQSSTCTGACDPGRYGSGASSGSSCTGPMTIGYFCTGGCSSPTQNACPVGYYGSSAGISACTQCGAGYFGTSTARTSSQCNGACTAGYYCTAGSTTATQFICPTGKYGVAGASSADCSGVCPAGSYCPAGSTSSSTPCPIGFYCPSNSERIGCPAGRYSTTSGLATINQCTICPSETYSVNAGSTSISSCIALRVFTNSSSKDLSQSRGMMAAAVVDNVALFVGGVDSSTPTTRIDVFNFSSGTWSRPFSLSVALYNVQGCVLGTKIVFAGGLTNSGKARDVHIYDLVSNLLSYNSVGLSVARYFGGIASVSIGSSSLVLYAGGIDNSNVVSARVDIYTLNSNSWASSSRSLTVSRAQIASASTRWYALFAGGYNLNVATVYNTVDMYDMYLDVWTTMALSQSRSYAVGINIGSLVIFAGGFVSGGSLSNRVDLYESNMRSWTTGSLSIARCGISATFSGIFAYFVGGFSSVNGATPFFSTIDVYNSKDNTWAIITALSVPLGYVSVVTFGSLIVVAGGLISTGASVNDVYYFNYCSTGSVLVNGVCGCIVGYYDLEFVCRPCPASFACSGGLVQPVTCPRGQYCPSNSGLYALDCPPGKYGNNTGFFSLSQCSNCEAGFYSLFAGSTASSSCVSSLAIMDYFQSNLTAPASVYGSASASVGNQAIIFGGVSGSTYINSVSKFNADTATFTSLTALTSVVAFGTACSVGTKVIYAGGSNSGSVLTQAAIWDSVGSNLINVANALSVGRSYLSCAVVSSLVVFAGGFSGTASSSVDIYDSMSNIWTSYSAGISLGRCNIGAASSGKIALFAGGCTTAACSLPVFRNVDIYDGSNRKWSTSALSIARANIGATNVGSLLLFAGGYYNNGGVLGVSSIVDIYDASLNIWSTTSLSSGRAMLVAASIGPKAFFVGGVLSASSKIPNSNVEIFDVTTSTWTLISSGLAVGVNFPSIVVMNKMLLISGGEISGGNTATALSTVIQYCSIGSILVNNICSCPIGMYDNGDACVNCPSGRYGSSFGITSSNCTAPCAAGFYGSSTGLTSSRCDGLCLSGYFCPPGSINSTYIPCCAGYHCPSGSSSCVNQCPSGLFCPAGQDAPPRINCSVNTVGNVQNFSTSIGDLSSVTSIVFTIVAESNAYLFLGSSPAVSFGTDEGFEIMIGGFLNTKCGIRVRPNNIAPGDFPYMVNCASILNATSPRYFWITWSDSFLRVGTGHVLRQNEFMNISKSSYPSSLVYMSVVSYLEPVNWNFCVAPGVPFVNSAPICPIGSFCPAGTSVPYPCSNGTYGAVTGLTNSSCSGQCSVGFYCPPGSINSTSIKCCPGSYCPAGSSFCGQYLCSAGYFGDKLGNINSTCNGPCVAGFYCPIGSISGTLNNCCEGYYCPTQSSNCTQVSCPAGSYCVSGSAIPVTGISPGYYYPINSASSMHHPCLAGYYGNQAGLTVATCTGLCSEGYYCPAGSSSPLSVRCPLGSFCPIGTMSATQYLCPAGTFGTDLKGTTNASCTGICSAGFYCSAGSTSPTRFVCPMGSYCPAGTGFSTQYLCPAGKYGNATGLTSSLCVDLCPRGFYCPSGTVSPIPCPPGSYCPYNSATPIVCSVAGYFCPERSSSNSQFPCAAGRYGTAASFTNSSCAGMCNAGYFCPPASTSPTALNCSAGYYCPSGTALELICDSPGFYCPPNSVISNSSANACSAGYFGNSPGLTSTNCTGLCSSGYYCLEASISPIQNICPPGYYCPSGTSNATQFPCSAGYFGISMGRTNNQCDGACFPGYFCDFGSTSSTQNICPVGSYCPAASSAGIFCPNGTTTLTAGRSTCDNMVASVSSISSSSADGFYQIGTSINLLVVFNPTVSAVYVTGNASLTVVLDSGVMVFAPYESGNGTLTLRFVYTVKVYEVSSRLRAANINALTGRIVGPDFLTPFNSSTLPSTFAANSLWSLKNIRIAGYPDTSSTLTCDRNSVMIGSNLTCYFAPKYQSLPFQYPPSMFNFTDSKAGGSFSVLIANGLQYSFIYTPSSVSIDTMLGVAITKSNVTISVYRALDSTTSLSCSPVIVAVSSLVRCTVSAKKSGSPVITNSNVLNLSSNRTTLVADSGGRGSFSLIPTGIISSSFNFTYVTPSKSGIIILSDGVSGNSVLLKVFDQYDGQVISTGNRCQP